MSKIPYTIFGGILGYGLACYHGVKFTGCVLGKIAKAVEEASEEKRSPSRRNYADYKSYYGGHRSPDSNVRRSGRYTWGESDQKGTKDSFIDAKVTDILKKQGMSDSDIAVVLEICNVQSSSDKESYEE